MRIHLLIASLVLCFAASAAARDIFVDNLLGDDRRSGTLPTVAGATGPCRSISKALRIAKPGDRIVVANTGQPYRESITVQGPHHSGTDRFPLVIIGNGATLDGTRPLVDIRWEHVGNHTFRCHPPFMSFQQLFLENVPAARQQPPLDQPPSLAPLQWCLVDGWIYFRVETGKLPEDYNLSYAHEQVGITLYEVHDVVIEDLVLRGFWLDGVNCHDNVRRTDLIRLTTKENGRSGISIGGASRVRIESCTSAGNGAAQIRVEGYCIVHLIENDLDAASAPAIVREGGRIVLDQ
jgi:hypothetical protein